MLKIYELVLVGTMETSLKVVMDVCSCRPIVLFCFVFDLLWVSLWFLIATKLDVGLKLCSWCRVWFCRVYTFLPPQRSEVACGGSLVGERWG